MGVILEIKTGAMAGKVIGLRIGESVTIGRAAAKAQFALGQDTFMSGLHFAVECGAQGCRVIDRKSSNGTFLNGAKIQEAMLANGDEIKAGQTIFAVKIVSDERLAAMNLPPVAASPAEPPQAPSPRAGSGAAEPPLVKAGPPAEAEKKPARVAEKMPPVAAEVREPIVESSPRPGAQGREQDVEVRLQEQIAAEPSAAKSPRAPQPATRDAAAPVEEPPRFRAIPRPPVAGAELPRGGAEQQHVIEQPPRVAPPPAPQPRDEFAGRGADRGGGAPRAGAFRVMGWSFPAVPREWQVQEGFGLQKMGPGEFPSSVAVTQETLGGITLQQFVESQISTLRAYLRDAKIAPLMPPRVGGADESMAVDVRHATRDGRELVYRYIYARTGSSVGILTVTTLAGDFARVLESLQPLLDGAEFQATVNV